jgi:hypothetical protein
MPCGAVGGLASTFMNKNRIGTMMQSFHIHKAYILISLKKYSPHDLGPRGVYEDVDRMLYPFRSYYNPRSTASVLRKDLSQMGYVENTGMRNCPRYEITDKGSDFIERYALNLVEKGLADLLPFEDIVFILNAYPYVKSISNRDTLHKLKMMIELTIVRYEDQLKEGRYSGGHYVSYLVLKNNVKVLKTVIKEVLIGR